MFVCISGHFERAEQLYAHHLRSLDETEGSNHPATLHAMTNLAELYVQYGHYPEAEPLFLHCLSVLETSSASSSSSPVLPSFTAVISALNDVQSSSSSMQLSATGGNNCRHLSDEYLGYVAYHVVLCCVLCLHDLSLYIVSILHSSIHPTPPSPPPLLSFPSHFSLPPSSCLCSLARLYLCCGRRLEARHSLIACVDARRERWGCGHVDTLYTTELLATVMCVEEEAIAVAQGLGIGVAVEGVGGSGTTSMKSSKSGKSGTNGTSPFPLPSPHTVFDHESLEEITSFFVTATGSMTGALTYAMLRGWEDVMAMVKKGLVTEEALQHAWLSEVSQKVSQMGYQEVLEGGGYNEDSQGGSQGESTDAYPEGIKGTVDLDGFLRLNVRFEQLMDESESKKTGTGTTTMSMTQGVGGGSSSSRSQQMVNKKRRSRTPSSSSLPPSASSSSISPSPSSSFPTSSFPSSSSSSSLPFTSLSLLEDSYSQCLADPSLGALHPCTLRTMHTLGGNSLPLFPSLPNLSLSTRSFFSPHHCCLS